MHSAGPVARGSVIAERFRIETLAGAGGMGSVYRAWDLVRSQTVALKLVRSTGDPGHQARLHREAESLARLSHPHVVGYVAHGQVDDGALYLAMEWLDGCDLDQRIQSAPLGQDEAVLVGVRLCDALIAVHELGILHRDIKPGNVFLPDGDVGRAILIDFGLALAVGLDTRVTQSNAFLGTPAFIAPEQARGEKEIDARADLYSLGAVLFTCLTGKLPFTGMHLMAVLSKLLLQPAPRVSDYRSDVAPALDALIARLMAKNPEERPATARHVARALADLDTRSAAPAAGALPARALSHGEQAFVTVLLLGPIADEEQQRAVFHEVAAGQNARIQRLADGTHVMTFADAGSPIEVASRAARCSLALHARVPHVPVIVATGRGVIGHEAPAGEVIDHAVNLYYDHDRTDVHADVSAGALAAGASPIIVDDSTAALIDKRFHLESASPKGHVLLAERTRPTGLARNIPLLGRERELGALAAIFDECMDESAPRAALITGAAGSGKSRLATDLCTALGERAPDVAIWTAHGDPMNAGSSFGMLAQLLRQSLGVTIATAPLAERRALIHERVSERFGAAEAARIAAFLGEIMDARFDSHDYMPLASVRHDPRAMHDQMRQAWEDWLDSELERRPVVFVLDDLQWGDLPSSRFVEAALRNLSDRPLMVLALARPDVHDALSALWAARAPERIALRPLSKRACMDIARALMDASDDQAVEHLAERCGGNPFYLEELVRQAARGDIAGAPDTVLAMVGARLSLLSGDERRLLRAASVLGADFWLGYLVEVLELSRDSVTIMVESLIEHDFIQRRRRSRVARETEYRFVHPLIQEASYATLTDADRVLAHQRAGQWLSGVGVTEALLLAEHFWRGKRFREALPYYQLAAEQALEADDLEAAIERAERAIACGPASEVRGALRLVQAEAHNWRNEREQARARSREAMERLSRGSGAWAHAVHQFVWAAQDQSSALFTAIDEFLSHIPETLGDDHLVAVIQCATNVCWHKDKDKTRLHSLQKLLDAHADQVRCTSHVAAHMGNLECFLASMNGDNELIVQACTRALGHWNTLGNQRNVCMEESNMGVALRELGQYEQAIEVLARCRITARRVDIVFVYHAAVTSLVGALVRMGRFAEGQTLITTIDASKLSAIQHADLRAYMAELALFQGHAESALHHIDYSAADGNEQMHPDGAARMQALRAQVLLALGRSEEALVAARRGMDILDTLGAVLAEGDALLHLVYAEALHATGDQAEANRAIGVARDRLMERAGRITTPEWRESFLGRVAENRRTLELAAAWLGT